MKRFLIIAAWLCGFAAAASADTITIATGKQGGGWRVDRMENRTS